MEEKEAISERIAASQRLVKILTEPPMYLSSSWIYDSKVLTVIANSTIKDTPESDQSEQIEKNDFGDKCLVCLPSDGIPRETWALLDTLRTDLTDPKLYTVNETTLDDLFYICFKYDINFTLISETPSSTAEKWSQIQLVIFLILRNNCKQRFPRTQNVPEIDEYYKIIGDNYAYQLSRFKDTERKVKFLDLLKKIPTIQHAAAYAIAMRAIRGEKV